MNCKYCDVEEEWKHDESNHPSQEVLSDFHLETRNVVKTKVLLNTIEKSHIKTILGFTSERLRSPKSPQRSESVFSPTSTMTNRPTNFTPSAPARLTPVSTIHNHQGTEKGLKTTPRMKEK